MDALYWRGSHNRGITPVKTKEPYLIKVIMQNDAYAFYKLFEYPIIDVNVCEYHGLKRTPLMVAVKEAPEFVPTLLKYLGIDINAVDYNGNNALYYASYSLPRRDPIRKQNYISLIHAGINVNNCDNTGKSILIHIVEDYGLINYGYYYVYILLDAGADLFLRDHSGYSAYDYAKKGLKHYINKFCLQKAMTNGYLSILPKDIREYIQLFSFFCNKKY